MPAAKLRPEHDDATAGHVLAAVVAHALDDRPGTRVAHGKALAGKAPEESPTGCGAIEHRVADDHVLLCDEMLAHLARGAHRDHTA
jgi:hypothetical protein